MLRKGKMAKETMYNGYKMVSTLFAYIGKDLENRYTLIRSSCKYADID